MGFEEQIVLCDEDGRPTGVAPKLASHHAGTPLHLAFSCYIFEAGGGLLVTQRARAKKVWPGVWTNSVCGHPAPGETLGEAVTRRADHELGMAVDVVSLVLARYRYVSPPFGGIVENEFCPVFVAAALSPPTPNVEEVAATRWMRWDDFVDDARGDDGDAPAWSWWCKDQIRLMTAEPSFHAAMSLAAGRAAALT